MTGLGGKSFDCGATFILPIRKQQEPADGVRPGPDVQLFHTSFESTPDVGATAAGDSANSLDNLGAAALAHSLGRRINTAIIVKTNNRNIIAIFQQANNLARRMLRIFELAPTH